MTAIAGITDGKTVWMGGDSASISGWDLTIRSSAKVFTAGAFVFGLTGSARMAQLLRYALSPAPPPAGGDIHAHMCTVFIDSLRACLKDAGFAKKDNEQESADGSSFLAAVNGRLFRIWPDYQVSERADGIDACGCAEDYVLGSLHTSAGMGWSPEKRLLAAFEAAERFSAGVRGPFHIVRAPNALRELA